LYNHLPPRSIRIFTLLPGSLESEIRGEFTQLFILNTDFNTDFNPRARFGEKSYDTRSYEALSYVWGPPEPVNTIQVNGQPFSVRPNLAAALKVLRYKDCPRALWIDAICINQLDFAERNSQVAVMYEVYRKADVVLSWLGEEEEGTLDVLDTLIKTKGEISKLLRKYDKQKNSGTSVKDLQISAQRWSRGFVALCTRPYWTRVWIIQEVLSARKNSLLCGGNSLPLYYFFDACLDIMRLRGLEIDVGITPASYVAQHYRPREVRLELSGLVDLCSKCNSKCQDPRDKIYGVLSLAQPTFDIVPDYKKSLLELYAEVSSKRSVPPIPSTKALLTPYADHHLQDYYILQDPGDMSQLIDPDCMAGAGRLIFHPSDLIVDSAGGYEHPSRRSTKSIGEYREEEEDAQLPFERRVTLSKWKGRVLTLKTDSQRLQEVHQCCGRSSSFDSIGNLADFCQRQLDRSETKSLPKATSISRIWYMDPHMAGPWANFGEHKEVEYTTVLEGAEWDRNLREIGDRRVKISDVSLLGGDGTKFLTLDGALGIGPCNVSAGDLLCHIEGSDRDFVVIRHLFGEDEFDLIGPATILQRKYDNDDMATSEVKKQLQSDRDPEDGFNHMGWGAAGSATARKGKEKNAGAEEKSVQESEALADDLILNSSYPENPGKKGKGRSGTVEPAKVEEKPPMTHLEPRTNETNNWRKRRRSGSDYRSLYVQGPEKGEKSCALNLAASTNKQGSVSKYRSPYIEDAEGEEGKRSGGR
jgi:hypothetical protein